MADEIDMGAAMAEISEGLGFEEVESGEGGADDVDALVDAVPELDGDKPGAESSAAPAGEAAAEKPETPASDAPGVTAPRTWRPEAAAQWAQVPPAVQQEILKREEDMFHGLEQYKADAGFGKQVQRVVEPFKELLQRYNIDPVVQINNLMQAHAQLALGTPQQKVQMFQRLMQDYGVNVDHLTGVEEIRTDPQVESLRGELASVKTQLQGMTQQQQAAYRAELEGKVTAFASDPKNIYFSELVDDIVKLLDSKVVDTLEQAYEKALWANPTTRAKEQARLDTERAEKAKREAAEKAQQARKATSTNVRTRSRSGSTAAPLGSIDDTLQEALAKIHSREQ
jgi:hypothetical protein